MDDVQAEGVLERIEVTIAMQQGMLVDEAERGNETVDGRPHCPPAWPMSFRTSGDGAGPVERRPRLLGHMRTHRAQADEMGEWDCV